MTNAIKSRFSCFRAISCIFMPFDFRLTDYLCDMRVVSYETPSQSEESEEDAVLVVGVSWRRDGDDVNI